MLLNAECGDIAAGERGFLNVPEPRQQVLSDIAKAVESRPRYVNVLVGRGDGLECVLDVLGEAVQTAEDVTLVVEHLNERDVPGYLLPTPEAAATLVENVRSPRLRLLYDAYHARMTGLDPAQDVANYKDLIAHVHYSEAPRRGAPGPDFWTSVAALEDMGYAGHLGLEYIASGDFRGPPVPEQLWQQRGPTR